MSRTAKILHFVTSSDIEVPEDTLVATQSMVMAVDRFSELKRQAKVIAFLMEKESDFIKYAMGDKTRLVDFNGMELATWKYNKDSEKVDKERLMREYPEVYNQVAELVEGSRVFRVEK